MPTTELPHLDAQVIDACAHAAHEANRAYCHALGDDSQPAWHDAPEWQKASARNGAIGALAGNTAAQSHALWLAEKIATGWAFGTEKDVSERRHPCMVPYERLPAAQRAKDEIFVTVVRAVARALSLTRP